ncbi:MAG: signal peptidase II [Pelagibacteraceae bacterium TMED216]|nr:MAG: signal peptidase II [Pelagibacteraceae bacterium TMED216]|tara:strand:- start:6365 stop:6871 length:507 start_codon:yes stop_codon:yes gene_type:complete
MINNIGKKEFNLKDILRKNIFTSLIILLCFFIDRLTKIQILKLNPDINKIFINDYVNIDLVWNTGIGFGLLSLNSNFFYHLVSIVIFVIIVFIFFLMIKSNIFEKYFYAIIIGGAIGNFYDRVVYFAVPDFIDLHYKDFHWFTFNFADIFITLGVILILIYEILLKND